MAIDINEKLSIRVNIAERYYPLRVDRGDEEKIRKAARLINDKLLRYKQRYSTKDAQDFLSMTALQLATQVVENEMSTDTSELAASIEELTNELATYIEDKKQVL